MNARTGHQSANLFTPSKCPPIEPPPIPSRANGAYHGDCSGFSRASLPGPFPGPPGILGTISRSPDSLGGSPNGPEVPTRASPSSFARGAARSEAKRSRRARRRASGSSRPASRPRKRAPPKAAAGGGWGSRAPRCFFFGDGGRVGFMEPLGSLLVFVFFAFWSFFLGGAPRFLCCWLKGKLKDIFYPSRPVWN